MARTERMLSFLVVGSILLAGCAGAPPGNATTTAPFTADGDTTSVSTTATTLPAEPPTANTPTRTRTLSSPGSVYDPRWVNLTVGEESDLPRGTYEHHYLVRNNASATQRITVTVWLNSTVVVNRSAAVPGGELLGVSVYRRGSYTVSVDPVRGERVVATPGQLDCNEHWYRFVVFSDGSIADQHIQTMVGCPTVTSEDGQ